MSGTLVVLAVGYGVLAMLTFMGGLRRHERLPLACLSAISFPIAWVVWYYRDEPTGLFPLTRGHAALTAPGHTTEDADVRAAPTAAR